VQVCNNKYADKTRDTAIRALLTSPPAVEPRTPAPAAGGAGSWFGGLFAATPAPAARVGNAIAATSPPIPTPTTTEPMVPKRDLDAANARNAELTATIAALQQDLAASRSTAGKREAELATATAELREAHAAVATAIAERDAARKTAAEQATAIAGLQTQVRELEAAAAAAPRGGAGAVAAVDHAACYTVGPVLGRGSFGVVHRAVTTPAAAAAGMKAGVAVAIKIMAAPTGEEEARKLQREMATLEKVRCGGHVATMQAQPCTRTHPLSSRRSAATRTSWRCWTTGATLPHAT